MRYYDAADRTLMETYFQQHERKLKQAPFKQANPFDGRIIRLTFLSLTDSICDNLAEPISEA